MNKWLLITHCVAILPMSVFMWSFKKMRDMESIFMLIKFTYCVMFSLFYHSYHVSDIPTIDSHFEVWTLLDGLSSSALIFTTTIYALRIRPPYFYIISYTIETGILMLYLFDYSWDIITWAMMISCGLIIVIKVKTIYKYVVKYYIISLLTIISIIFASIYYINARENEIYTIYHSLWHCFIFLSASFSSLLKYKLDKEIQVIHNRLPSESI